MRAFLALALIALAVHGAQGKNTDRGSPAEQSQERESARKGKRKNERKGGEEERRQR